MKQSKGRYVFDIEANGLLFKADTIWCIVVKDIDTLERTTYSDLSKQDHVKSLQEGLDLISRANVLIGHNIYMYDIILLKLLHPELELTYDKALDTMILSQLLHFNRRLGKMFGRHGLEYWGEKFGIPKPKQEQWRVFEEKMINRCEQDVDINFNTYRFLIAEAKSKPQFTQEVVRREMRTAEVSMKQVVNGWLFDKEKALAHIKTLDKRIKALAEEIEPNLPPTIKSKATRATWEEVNAMLGGHWKTVPKPQRNAKGAILKPARKPTILKYTASGKLHAHISKYFPDVEQLAGPFTKVEFHQSTMAQHAQVKKFLFKMGWKPTTWNYQKDAKGKIMRDVNRKPIKKSPKLTEDSYDSIQGELGKKVALHNTLDNRRSTLANRENKGKGWVNTVRPDGRLTCIPRTMGAATARMTHSGVVNVPGGKAVFGKEMRGVFIAPDGRVIVACDMASAQLRLLAAAMGDPAYMETVLTGSEHDADGNYVGTDVHSVNGIAAGLIDPTWPTGSGVWVKGVEQGSKQWTDGRAKAKTFIYALLFGAGDEKIGTIIMGGKDEGAILRESFLSKLPSLDVLIDRLKNEWKRNKRGGEGWFEGLDGRRIYCSSAHKILNYKLQSDEAILLKEWLCIIDEDLEEKHLTDPKLLLSYHDEVNFETDPNYAHELGAVLKSGIKLAGQRLGLTCPMDGDYAIGESWADVH